jgi:CHRD domain
MRRRVLSAVTVATVAALIATLGLGAGAVADDNGDRHGRFEANLTGEAEVPGPGDADGSGSARVEIKPSQGVVCFDLRWEDIDAPTAGHIHFGAPDVAGPVVVTFFMSSTAPDQPPPLPETLTGVRGCTEEVAVPEGAPFDSPEALLRNIKRHPRQYYVNVHNLAFPAGAIRGQLARDD